MQYCDMVLSWLCIAAIVVPCDFTDSWVAAYAAPKFEMVSPYETTESLLLLVAIPNPLDYAEANVNDVMVSHCEAVASCKRHAGEEAKDECVQTVGGMPVGHHALMVCFAIFCRSLSVVVDKPHKHINKNYGWFAKAPL
jgi:hypothetical protein